MIWRIDFNLGNGFPQQVEDVFDLIALFFIDNVLDFLRGDIFRMSIYPSSCLILGKKEVLISLGLSILINLLH